MNNKISIERKQYLKNVKKKKYAVTFTQILILIGFIAIWEILADHEIIDSFITSQPSRILDTFLNLTSNDLLKHVGVTIYETVVGFLLGTGLGILIAIILWWSDFLSRVFEPYLVVLNSLPKVALRTSYNYLGWSGNTSNYCNGSCNSDGGLLTTSDEIASKVQEISNNGQLLDKESASEFFKEMKESEMIPNSLTLKLNRKPKIIDKKDNKIFEV